MPSLAYLFQVEDGFDGNFGDGQHAQMGGVDRGRPNLDIDRTDSLNSQFRFALARLPRRGFFNLPDFRSTNLMKTYYLCHLFSYFVMRAGYMRRALGAPGTLLR